MNTLTSRATVDPRSFGAVGDGQTLDTAAIQTAIDKAAETGGRVELSAGTYLTGAIFLRSGIEFEVGEGAILLADTDDESYPTIFSRVAGIEMDGPAALINVIEQHDVRITGQG